MIDELHHQIDRLSHQLLSSSNDDARRLALLVHAMHHFTYEELKPLCEYLYREATLTEKHFPGWEHIIQRLMQIREENLDDSKRRDITGSNSQQNDSGVQGQS